jgi:hypothetical protein
MAEPDPIEIPVAFDTPLYTERVTLDGVEYLLKFDWNDRENRWYLGLFSVTGSPLATGIKIVANWPLLRKIRGENMPPGVLSAVDLSPLNGESPTYSELGARVKLVYRPKNG